MSESNAITNPERARASKILLFFSQPPCLEIIGSKRKGKINFSSPLALTATFRLKGIESNAKIKNESSSLSSESRARCDLPF
jgi:hypothetical protein